MTERLKITRGSGNVFLEFGFASGEKVVCPWFLSHRAHTSLL